MKILFTTLFDPDDLGSKYLAAYLKLFGHEVRIVNLKKYGLTEFTYIPDDEDLKNCSVVYGTAFAKSNIAEEQDDFTQEYVLYAEELKNWAPDIIGIGTRSKNLKYFPDLIPVMRTACPKAFIVAGGIGPTLDPEQVLECGVDAVIRGEGEYALLDLLTALEKGEDWHAIQNVSWQKNGQVVKNALRPQEKDLNVFPLPVINDTERVLITNGKRYTFADPDIPWKNNIYVTLGSRGCILDCSYCGGRSILKVYESVPCYNFRQRSLKKLQHELEHVLKTSNYNFIDFHDEFFIYPVQEMMEFFTWYNENVNLPFYANLSASQLYNHSELLNLILEAGFYNFGVGLQSGDEEFCRRVYNRKNNNMEIKNVINKCWENNLSSFMFMIVGNPLEKEENLINTYNFCLQLPKVDPSLKRKIFFITTKFYLAAGDVPIKASFPELLHLPLISHEEFYRQAMLLECCLLLDEKEFWDLYDDDFYKENPHLLADFYYNRLQKMHEAYLLPELAKLKGKKVWVFGGGSAWQHKKHLLKDVQIEGILMDFQNAPEQIDGIPVYSPDIAFSKNLEYHLIIIAKRENINTMYKKIISRYHYKNSHIILCADLPQREDAFEK